MNDRRHARLSLRLPLSYSVVLTHTDVVNIIDILTFPPYHFRLTFVRRRAKNLASELLKENLAHPKRSSFGPLSSHSSVIKMLNVRVFPPSLVTDISAKRTSDLC